MKKHLAVLCGVFYPKPSPTGLCVQRFVSLLSDSYDIDVVCISSSAVPTEIEENGVRIHALLGKRMQMERNGSVLKCAAAHAIGAAQIKTSVLGNLSWFYEQSLELLKQLHQKNPVDAVFSVCSPFAAHCAAKEFVKDNPNVRWCAYTVDPDASDGRIRPFCYSTERLSAYECGICDCADTLLLSEEVYATRNDLRNCNADCRRLPYLLPTFPDNPIPERNPSNKYINCVYAGRFYSKIRNPEQMLTTFHAVSNPNLRLHLYSTGCEDVVKRFAAKDSRILLHATVSSEEIRKIYQEADFLVNVENSLPEFMPSKLFEYIAACRPIISFGSGQSRILLAAHPASFIACGAGDASKLQSFLETKLGTIISAAEIEKLYEHHSQNNIRRILIDALSES